MRGNSLKRQAAILSCVNALVRALGFALHIVLGRLLGAEALGVMELSQSAHMLSITPVTAGLPLAVSRATAQRRGGEALAAGRSLALRMSAVLLPLWLLLSPALSLLLGDARTLPALWVFTPCILLLGLSSVYSGYCYGLGRVWPPALSTLTEQLVRFSLSALLLLSLPALTVAARAAVPAAAALTAEAAALGVLLLSCRRQPPAAGPVSPALRRELFRLSAPLTLTRLLQTLSRAALGALLPRRLMAAGLTPSAATAALGMRQGMVMPVLFLPGIITGAVGMVGVPAIAGSAPARLRGLALRLLAAALLCGGAGWGAVYGLAPFLARAVYRQEALVDLFRSAAPLTLLFALHQTAGTLLAGLGEQKKTLLPAIAGAALTLGLVNRWAATSLGLQGAVYALLLGRAFTLLWQLSDVLALIGTAASAGPKDAAAADP